MKRLFVVLALLVFLGGCAVPQTNSTEPTGHPPAIESTTGPALYDAERSAQQGTEGAVKAFQVEDGCNAVAVVGENVVLFYDDVLRSYSGEMLHLVKELPMQTTELPGQPDFQINGQTMGYYDEISHAVVMLNGQLKELAHVKLSDRIQGAVALADTLDTLYFCTADSIRALNLKTGNSHMIRQQEHTAQAVVRNCFGGDILGCEVYNRDRQSIVYISTETGELLGTSDREVLLQTGGAFYFAQVNDGTVKDCLFGGVGETPCCLHPAEADAPVYEALTMDGVFTAAAVQDGMKLDFYDLTSGSRTASVTLNGVNGTVVSSWADPQRHYLWVLVDEEAAGTILYGWELGQTPASDTSVYTAPRYTAENPDVEGLSRCEQTAATLGDKYGLQILIAQAPEGCDLGLTDEYQVSLIEAGLTALDQALSRYPAELLGGINSVSGAGKVTLTLVRDIAGEKTVDQYWNGSDACIVLELGDGMEEKLDKGLYHVLDTYLFNNSSTLDQWNELNPKGFRYDMNDTDYVNRQEDLYLTGDKRSFADSLAMSFPVEDRAGIFALAMSDDGAEAFASATMQKKLVTLCKAIRDAFDWKKAQESFVWGQHLAESMAYQPKK
jgi:hypothetical protein